MHILHVYKDYFPVLGGIENHVRTLAELQVAANHKVTVLVTNPGGQPAKEMINGVEVMRLPRLATVASTPLSFHFPAAIRRLKPDITHLQFPYPVGEVSQLIAARERPFVVSYQADVVRQKTILRLYRPLMERMLNQAGMILANSERYLETSTYLSARKDRCRIVVLSVDPEPFENAEPLVPKGEKPVVLFVGKHRYYKGLDDLIRAVAGLDVHLLIGGEGPLRKDLEHLVFKLGLERQAQFVGEVADADLPGLYASADIFVLPANSRAEAFGIVLLEAMASGLPCVTTELGTGTSYVVQDGITGLVVPPRTPEALRSAIEILMSDPVLRRRFGQAGRERVRTVFTPERLHKQVMEIYDDVLAARG